MGLTINIIILVIGSCLFGYGKYIDSSENYKALGFMVFGVIFFICGALSNLILWIFG